MRHFNRTDQLLTALDTAVRTVWGRSQAGRPSPLPTERQGNLSPEDRKLSGSLMRVNHVGEVCAQALYQSQAMATSSPALRAHFEAAAREEEDHLAWTQQRLDDLGDRRSLLNPLWYAGAFGLGWLAGKAGDAISLGFVVETERQVEAHLDSHLQRLPEPDATSRAIVAQMKADEAAHAAQAEQAGARPVPGVVKGLMQAAGKVMTTSAHWI